MDEEDLRYQCKQIKKQIIQKFKEGAIGNEQLYSTYLEDLKINIQEKVDQIKEENYNESVRAIDMFLTSSFTGIERQLKGQHYQSLEQFEEELGAFQNFAIESGPQGPQRDVMILEFTQKALIDAAHIFNKNF